MKQEQLQAIRERCEKATPGPWAVTTLMSRTLEIWQGIDNSCICRIIASGTAQDAEFIARAREDIPALLAEVERLKNENQMLRALMQESIDNCETCQGTLGNMRCARCQTFEYALAGGGSK